MARHHNPRGLRGTPADAGIPDPNAGAMNGLANGYSTPPINNQEDPLGIALRQRSVTGENAGVTGIPFGADPMGIQHQAAIQSLVQASSDPQGFNTMNQALNERYPSGIHQSAKSGPAMPGVPAAPNMTPSTMWQSGQTSAVTGSPYDPAVAITGLQQQKPVKRGLR